MRIITDTERDVTDGSSPGKQPARPWPEISPAKSYVLFEKFLGENKQMFNSFSWTELVFNKHVNAINSIYIMSAGKHVRL